MMMSVLSYLAYLFGKGTQSALKLKIHTKKEGRVITTNPSRKCFKLKAIPGVDRYSVTAVMPMYRQMAHFTEPS